MIFYEKFASLIMQRYKILTIFIGINNSFNFANELLNEPLLQVQSEVNGTTHIDIEEIRNFTNGLIYPLYFLDFETIGPQFQNIMVVDHTNN
jgi:hypothetical protein